ncbi:MAG TPA: hypothetical protein VJU14_06925, partial [Solirubrobacterales bacterium]|nr:hypothetical protein [Solirubrobacterales bacterium]
GIATFAAAALLALPAGGEALPACTVTGTAAADVLRGTKQADVICARGGVDKVFGRAGADVIRGEGGDDALAGGGGADRLYGGNGRDRCRDGSRTFFRGCERRPARRVRLPNMLGCCFASPEPPDVTAPEVVAVAFSDPFVDTSSQSSIGIWIEAVESQSGIGRVEVALEGPQGPWQQVAFESSSRYGGGSGTIDVPASTPAGKYRVTGFSLTDRAGNRVSFDATQVEERGFDAEFDVFEGPDTEGPQLTDLSLDPASLDTSAGPGSVLFSLAATDDLSGVEDAAALVRLPASDPPICFPCGHRAPARLASGTIFDGVWEERLQLPRYATPGTYPVSAVVLYDRAGNRTAYGPEELEGLGYPVEFTQTGAGDTQPPEVVDFWMNRDTVRAAAGDGAIQFFIRVEDDLSGVGESDESPFERLRVDIAPPHASEWGYRDGGMAQVSGTHLDGVWRFEYGLPPDAETGTWTIPAIEATDRAGNETLLRGAELQATGWDLTFENLP